MPDTPDRPDWRNPRDQALSITQGLLILGISHQPHRDLALLALGFKTGNGTPHSLFQ